MPSSRRSSPNPIRVYARLLDPREHPDYGRRAVQPPSWEVFEGRTQFTCLRSFEIKDGRITGIADEIERYTQTHALGKVVWPSYPILFASNLAELADEIKKRGLYLFDIWGYVPGSGPGGYWQQFKVPVAALQILETTLGDRWLGTDIGEQDGRYLNGYAGQMTPASASRGEQYRNFQRHFERMGDDLGHRHATLVSLNFGHYLIKEGTFTLIGAETAQALPNNQVYYAFIRGAGKQYGVPWFGNASVYNRWGYKTYGSQGKGSDGEYGPTKGSSLSLLRRLLYTHLLYNGMIAGFEAFWIEDGKLTPIGAIQQAAQRWVLKHGQPGVMHTPVALLVDFHAGWTFPRHLYTTNVYRVWGNLPYGEGDYLTDAILDLLYPGYQNSSYYHDESGFIAPTPHGDIADCLLSDAEGWLLARYPVLVVAGELAGGQGIRDKLEAYAAQGGHLILTAGNLAKLPGGLAGRTSVAKDISFRHGLGRITCFARVFGVQAARFRHPMTNEIDRPLAKPYVLAPEVRSTLERIFRGQELFSVRGEGLSIVTCRKGRGRYTVGIANNTWRETKFSIRSRCGFIEAIEELAIDPSAREAIGWLPEGVDMAGTGSNGAGRIAGGDIRIFAIKVKEKRVTEIVHRLPPARPRGRLLTLRSAGSIKDALLDRPTFFAHYDGVVVDWRYFHERESAALQGEAGWIRRQGLRVVADLSSGLNLYPTLRLLDNVAEDYAASMATIDRLLSKLELLGARDLLITLHRYPENNITPEEAEAAMVRTCRSLAQKAAAREVTLHLRMAPDKPLQTLGAAAAFLDKVAEPNLKLAPALGMMLAGPVKPGDSNRSWRRKLGFWLAAAPQYDVSGRLYGAHGSLHGLSLPERRHLRKMLAVAPEIPVVFDALHTGPEEEYLDAGVLAEK